MGTRKALGRALAALLLSALVAAMLVSLRSSATAAVPGDPLCVTKPAKVAASATKLLTIGDSLTSASAGDYTWRYFLWKHLVNPSGSTTPPDAPVDFVGPFTNMVQPVSPYARTSDDYTCDFDKQNGALPGSSFSTYLAAQNSSDAIPVASTVVRNLVNNSGDPGALVVFLGAQDLTKTGDAAATAEQVVARASTLVTEARKANASIDIVFATAPVTATNPSAKAVAFNNLLTSQAPGWSTASSKVAVAQTAKNWSTPALTYDTIHPNPQGEVGIAADIADALTTVGVGAASTRPLPDYSAYVGPHQAAVLAQPTVSGGTTVNLSWTLPPGSTVSKVQRRASATGPWVDFPAPVVVAANQAGPPYVSTATDPTFTAEKVYQYRVLAAKSTTVWSVLYPGNAGFLKEPYVQYPTTLTSNVVTVPAGATFPPTSTPTSTPTVTPTSTPTSTPTVTPTVTPTPTPTVTPTTPAKPGAVPGFAAKAGVHAVTLSWGTAANTNKYWLYYGAVGSDTNYAIPLAFNVRSYKVSNLTPGRTYGFRIQGVFGASSGPISGQLRAAPQAYALAKVKKPKLSTLSGKRIKVTWSSVAHATRYEVQRRAVGGSWKTVANSAAKTYKTGKLTRGKKYEFRVRACDGPVPGPYSSSARITVT